MIISTESDLYNSKELLVELKFCYTQLGEANRGNPFVPSKSMLMQRINFYRSDLKVALWRESLV